MTSTKLLAIAALAITGTCGIASAQLPEGRIYDFDFEREGCLPLGRLAHCRRSQ